MSRHADRTGRDSRDDLWETVDAWRHSVSDLFYTSDSEQPLWGSRDHQESRSYSQRLRHAHHGGSSKRSNRDSRERQKLIDEFEQVFAETARYFDKADAAYQNRDFLEARKYFCKAERGCAKELELATKLRDSELTLQDHRRTMEDAAEWVRKSSRKHTASLQREYQRHLGAAEAYRREPMGKQQALIAYRKATAAMRDLVAFNPAFANREHPNAFDQLARHVADLERIVVAQGIIWDMAVLLQKADQAIATGSRDAARRAFNAGIKALEDGVRVLPEAERPPREFMDRFVRSIQGLEARAVARFGAAW